MAFHCARLGLILLAAASLLATGQARTIIVGGSKGWRSGVNYTEWAIQNQPFYHGDTLVFKYSPPLNNVGHSVHLLPDLWSYVKCDFKASKLLANPTQGRGGGFSIVLNQWRPYYFASSEGDGYDCNVAEMKFIVVPWLRVNY